VSVFRDPVQAAIRALEAEMGGGPRAEFAPGVERLALLLTQREEILRARERAQPERELLAAMPDAAGLVTPDGKVRVSNAVLDGLAPGGRAIGLSVLEITRNEELAEGVKRALEGSPKRLEIQLGQRTWVCHLVPLLRGEALLLLRDVTGARMAESTRRDFVANASHELRTPVSAIAGAAETLLSGAMDDPPQARAFVEMIARNAERLARLTNDLLDLSRIESRQWPVRLEPVSVEATARRAIEVCSEPARRKQIELSVEIPEGTAVMADARALEQVLVNLLDNAVKYTPDGGKATVSTTVSGNLIDIAVTDTGQGIERHHLPRLFERFYRVDPGRSRGSGGTGLGLAIVKHLVQMQAGDIGVETGAGGTSFRVRLPRSATQPVTSSI
jgi:two-component system phosphate regulon sensor histidine kinase PhoR